MYVKSVINPDGTEASATSGHFMADASLMATFGQVERKLLPPVTDICGTIAPNMLNTLTGDITNFDLSGGEYNEWAVNLQGDIDDDGDRHRVRHGANGGGAARVVQRHLPRSVRGRLTPIPSFPSPAPWLANSTPTSATAPWPAASGRGSSRPSQEVRFPSMRI